MSQVTEQPEPCCDVLPELASASASGGALGGAEMRRPVLTKIVATVGPASSAPDLVRRLIEAGVCVFRLNFSHGTLDEHAQRLQIIREVSMSLGRPIAVLGDLPGPKIRVGEVEGDGIDIATGAQIIVQREPVTARAGERIVRFSSRYPQLIDDVELGQRLLIADGSVRTLIIEKHDDHIVCAVTSGGRVSTGKGINLPDSHIGIEILGERDLLCAEWAVENDVDYLALSFVRSANDVRKLMMHIEGAKRRSGRTSMRMPIVAKIELPQAVKNIDEIVDVSDAIMVARGDLGVEMDLAQVPVIQKKLIAAARAYAKPCIVATQMLESMINSPTPTRAEASDVAGAILDGADAVMLSGETAVGHFPTLAVEHMRRIAEHTEQFQAESNWSAAPPRKPLESQYRTACLAHGAWTVANDLGAKFIIVWSQQGGGARHLSQLDFHIPIIAISTDDRALRQMQLMRGVTPIRMPLPEGLAHFTQMVDLYLTECGWAREGDACVLVAGAPLGRAGVTNSLAIHRIGDSESGYAGHA